VKEQLMTKRKTFLVIVVIAVLAAVAIAQAHTTHASRSSGATIELHETALGKILVSSAGLTLYDFSKDQKNKDACQSIGGCTSVWPPLIASGAVKAGSGLNASELGTIALSSGKKQVTYYGRPLYLYTGDEHAGETSYVGASQFGGKWLAVNAKGRSVQAPNGSKEEQGSGSW
jgi:predicted lipoprotein with Yx(FWY)xxD motif